MIFDFTEKLGLRSWDNSDLAFNPPKSLKDYFNDYKSLVVDNLILGAPFLSVFVVSGSLNYYSFLLQQDLNRFQDSHLEYQSKRSMILDGKRNLAVNEESISSLSPFIVDSIYPNLFLSLLTPIFYSDSSITELSLTNDISRLRITSSDTDQLSSIYSTLDQHPLVKKEGISFNSLKGSSGTLGNDLSVSSSVSEMEINFSYNYLPLPDLIKLFEKSNSESLSAKASLFQLK